MRMLVDERAAHLAGLARLLDARGCRVRLLTPDGLPLLQLTTGGPALTEAQIVCDLAAYDTWWFRWRHGEHIAPADEPDVAAAQIAGTLGPAHRTEVSR